MSLKTWKKEFYSTPAARVSKRNAVEHSIKKWTGLLKSNLKKHGVYVEGLYPPRVTGDDGNTGLLVDSGSCALCVHYFKHNQAGTLCGDCPLYKALGNTCCDNGSDQPYTFFINNLNPKPMLVQLRRARKFDTAAKAKP